MQFTRKQIIDFLKAHPIGSIPEISLALNLTIGNIRHHIGELETQGVVEQIGNLPQKGRGRPTKLYCLSKNALNHNFDYLVEILLAVATQDLSNDEIQTYYQKIASKMTVGIELHSNWIQRLNHAIQWLSNRNYQARWEASPTGPKVILGHCPYVAILDTNPEMCQIDTLLISRLSGAAMQHTAKLKREPCGSRQCVFVTRI